MKYKTARKYFDDTEFGELEVTTDNNNVTQATIVYGNGDTQDVTPEFTGQNADQLSLHQNNGNKHAQKFAVVSGKLTSKTDMLRLNNIQAKFDYRIESIRVRSHGNAGVATKIMKVDFANSSWTMNRFHGTNITNGKIDGNRFDSNNSIVATSKQESIGSSSFVKGSFFGTDAGYVAGTADIQRIHNKNPKKSKHIQAIFAGSKVTAK